MNADADGEKGRENGTRRETRSVYRRAQRHSHTRTYIFIRRRVRTRSGVQKLKMFLRKTANEILLRSKDNHLLESLNDTARPRIRSFVGSCTRAEARCRRVQTEGVVRAPANSESDARVPGNRLEWRSKSRERVRRRSARWTG